MESFISYIARRVRISKELKLDLEKVLLIEKHKKGSFLVEEGTYCRKLYYVKSGLIRSYCYDQEKEITTEFYFEDNILTSWYSFFSKRQSYDYLELLEDSELISINHMELEKLYDKYPELERFMRLLLEELFAVYDYLSKGILSMTAKKKYELLLSIYPQIEQRVNLGYIASYLGISQETLSRIRGK